MPRFLLGLHTKEERSRALDLARAAYDQGRRAFRDENGEGVVLVIGYLMGLQDLAQGEGAKELARSIHHLRKELEDLSR